MTADRLAEALGDALAGGDPIVPVPAHGAEAVLEAVRPGEPVKEADIAAVVTTSGSTGHPRPVLLSRSAILASVAATHARLGGPGAWTCVLPTHYVAGLMVVARAVATGSPVRFGRGDLSDLPAPDARAYISLVPAQLHRALDDPAAAERLAGYATVLLGGAAVDTALLERAAAAGIAVVTTYGMAETCGGVVYDGRPLDGVGVRFEPAEPASGRVLLTTPTAFRGYRFDPDATAAVLDGSTVRTSDRGRWADGRLVVDGRLDDVVISGGVNVDLASLQARLDAAWGPSVVVAYAVPDPTWGALIAAATTGDVGVDDLRAHLPDLDRAAVPRVVTRWAVLPTTSTGKPDRRRLAAAHPRPDPGRVG